jgi:cyclophilin family peptidyl-prolyl cis-trans isomerase
VLQSYLTDFDPAVAAAAADVLAVVTGTRPAPSPRWRAPEQPTEAEIRALPTRAQLTMADGGVVELRLLVDDAPLTVARFVKLQRAGRFDGRTFHRIVPLFVVQGLSPGANEYMGDARYLRDEIGAARHTRGAVGISTRGRHTGDGQIFFDLIAVPRLNYDYTVFATVESGMPVVDAMLEGARVGRGARSGGRSPFPPVTTGRGPGSCRVFGPKEPRP